MGVNKLTYIVVGSIFLLVSCGGSSSQPTEEVEEQPTVSLDEYNDLREKYDLLKASSESTLAANERARQELDEIMVELSNISGRTINLQKDIENGRAKDNRSRAQHISESLAIIKRRLNAVSTTGADKQTLALVENLRKTITLNEQEIARLNGVIEDKNQQISTLDNELADKNAQLQQVISDMKAAEQASWMHMGSELTRAADLLPDVKGHGNMKEVKKAKLLILQRAKSAYEQAYRLGCYDATARIREVEAKYDYANNR